MNCRLNAIVYLHILILLLAYNKEKLLFHNDSNVKKIYKQLPRF